MPPEPMGTACSGTATLTYQLALGRPDLTREFSYTLQGVKAEIDAIIWCGGNV